MVERVTSCGVGVGRRATVERARFLDVVVNGILMRDQLRIAEMDAGCTPLRSAWPLALGLAWLDQLADPRAGGLASGRVAIFVCQVCADVDCGVLSVSIERSGGVVRWNRFGWEGPGEGARPVDGPAGTMMFEFEEAAYDALLEAVRTRVAAGAQEIPAGGHLWWKIDRHTVMHV